MLFIDLEGTQKSTRSLVEVGTMQIPCISCQSLFHLDSNLVQSTGSLVRCSKCEYIFIVYPPAFDNKPVVKGTDIEQSILYDLFKVEHTAKDKRVIPESSKISHSHSVDEILSIKDFEEEEDD